MARPTKRTKELVGKLEYAFSIGATVTEACLYADISRDTYYEWTKADKELSDRFTELQSNPIFIARESVYKGIQKDPDLALKFLERKKSDEFSTKSQQDLHIKELPKPLLGGNSVSANHSNQQDPGA